MVKNIDYLKLIKDKKLNKELLKGNFGLEKENIRVDKEGKLALTLHPQIFGDKLKNPYITTDFAESQVEMITPIFETIEECYYFLENLHDIVSLQLKDEYLWPQSNPPYLPKEEEIPIAIYDNKTLKGKEAKAYRERLAKNYGKKKQLISGIHYNFSFKEELLKRMYDNLHETMDFIEFKNNIYLKLCRNFLKYRWFLIYLTGASPVLHKTYEKNCIEFLQSIDKESYYKEHVNSFRNGICGYKNKEEIIVSHDSVKEYVQGIERLINTGELHSVREYYSPIRLKTKNTENILGSLLEDGIEYVEIRLLDLNPLTKVGINLDTLYLVHLFVLYTVFADEEPFDDHQQVIASLNHELSASFGRSKSLSIFKEKENKVAFKEQALDLVDNIKNMIEKLELNSDYFVAILNDAKEKIVDNEKTNSSIIFKEIQNKSYINYHIEKSKEYLNKSKEKEFTLKGYEDLELSTQILIKEAVKRGIQFEIIDRKENFIVLKKDNKIEYIKQATKTSLDSYITFLVMENKLVTKTVLDRAGIRIPKGKHYKEIEEAKNDHYYHKNKPIVIKPKSTNFGLGITILKENFTQATYERAVEIAFEHDNSILIEEFIEGKEYRIFVTGDEVVAILHRVPANVTGDGTSSIRQLVVEKNKDPLRGKGYKTPLEKIKLEEAEEMFLKEQNKDFDYIPLKDEIVYLRKNSNVSTGGDSIDYTDDILESYKKVAIKAAKAVGASICGVDMMITDITKELNQNNYGIIELNFNPAIHIHCYPYKGKNRKLGEKILKLLGF